MLTSQYPVSRAADTAETPANVAKTVRRCMMGGIVKWNLKDFGRISQEPWMSSYTLSDGVELRLRATSRFLATGNVPKSGGHVTRTVQETRKVTLLTGYKLDTNIHPR